MKNIPPHTPLIYIATLELTGINLFFLFLFQNIDCGYSPEPPQRGGAVLTCTHNQCFEHKY